MALKVYRSLEKGFKLKLGTFWALIGLLENLQGENGRGPLCSSPILSRIKQFGDLNGKNGMQKIKYRTKECKTNLL